MATEKAVVLLFEDDDSIAQSFVRAINPLLLNDLQLVIFPLDQPAPQSNLPYEDRVEDVIKRGDYLDRLKLVVTDRDLSTKSEHWRGLSQAAVSVAARNLGIPVASYRRRRPNVVEDIQRIPGDGLIELPGDVAQRAKMVSVLARGFVDLAKRIAVLGEKKGKKGKKKSDDVRLASPGVLLANVLEQPVTAGHFDTFACGDQIAIAEILRVAGSDSVKISPAIQRRLIAALGVWLADVVMKYPGVLLNAKAAASYLDISADVFIRKDVAEIFSQAKYTNLPFADDLNPMWWRHILDDVIADNECVSGLEVCQKKGLKRLKFCACSVDSKLHAGYYCMATEEPISAEKSSGHVRWFPPGADLARLSQSTYRKVAPWMGT